MVFNDSNYWTSSHSIALDLKHAPERDRERDEEREGEGERERDHQWLYFLTRVENHKMKTILVETME